MSPLMVLAEIVYLALSKAYKVPKNQQHPGWSSSMILIPNSFSKTIYLKAGAGGQLKTILEFLPCCTITAQKLVLVLDMDRQLDGQA